MLTHSAALGNVTILLAVQFERIAVCNLAAVPDGHAYTFHQVVIAGPFCGADRLKITSKNRRGGFFIGGGAHAKAKKGSA